MTSAGIYFYVLDVDSAVVESSPDVISPDANAGDKRWVLVTPFAAITSRPTAGEHQVKKIRRDGDGNVLITYESEAES